MFLILFLLQWHMYVAPSFSPKTLSWLFFWIHTSKEKLLHENWSTIKLCDVPSLVKHHNYVSFMNGYQFKHTVHIKITTISPSAFLKILITATNFFYNIWWWIKKILKGGTATQVCVFSGGLQNLKKKTISVKNIQPKGGGRLQHL